MAPRLRKGAHSTMPFPREEETSRQFGRPCGIISGLVTSNCMGLRNCRTFLAEERPYKEKSMAQSQYSDTVIDHFTNPRNMGEIEDASCVAEVGNPACGDMMKLSLKIEDGIIVDAKFKTFGCSAAIASSSMTTELIIGKTVEEASRLSNETVAEALGGLPPAKKHCSVLAEEALHAALEDYKTRQGRP